MTEEVVQQGVNCAQCGHPFDPHVLVTGDPLKGGIILCPVYGCGCFATFGIPQLGVMREDVVIPTDEELEVLRSSIQGPEPGS